jgi:RNA polymerase sigma-70 factor (ECF subfamily)
MKLSREQFENLALEQIDAIARVARSLTRNAADADDLVQETYLRALRAWESFDLKSFGIKPWLLRILHNTFVSRAEREARQPKAIESAHLQSMPDVPEPAFDAWEPSEELSGALTALPPDLRNTLLLWAMDDLKYEEIAHVMDIPVGTVMSRLHRARNRLRELLSATGHKGRSAGNGR